MRTHLGALLGLLLSFFAVPQAFAATSTTTTNVHIQVNGRDIVNTTRIDGEHINTYATNVVINPAGSISVSESIEYVFDEPRHGITRSIPYTKTNTEGKRHAMDITNIQVKDPNGKAYTYEKSFSDSELMLKVGDADKTISGTHVYIISYDVAGALTYFPGHDELYWNSVGNQWRVPIQKATTQIILPAGDVIASGDIHTQCFVGTKGSTNTNCTARTGKNTISIESTKALSAYEGLTAVIGFPKGLVAVLEPREVVPFFETVWGKIVAVALMLLALLWYVILPLRIIIRWFRFGRDPKPAVGEAKSWFSPPTTSNRRALTPAETGALVDETVDLRDIYASIVDLARRGYIKIIETKKEEFDIEKVKEWNQDSDVLPFEQELLAGILGSETRVKIKDIQLQSTFEKVKKTIYTTLVTEKFFPENPQTIRIKYGILAFLSFMTFNPILFLVALTFGQRMPRKTVEGAEAAAVARALKTFLTSQEKKLTFQASKQMMFEKLLPFAIAFGVEEIWAKRFADMKLHAPDWYVARPGTHFSSVVFAHSIGAGMSVSFAASVHYQSSRGYSSGFSSGGGFSGGGGGGGGGGSW
jgi:uncharacterized membrane protein YgcG